MDGRAMDGSGSDTLRTVYHASYRRLVAQLAAVVGGVSEAEDLVQEAFVRATAQRHRFETLDNPEAWVRTVALNLARSRWRRRRRATAIMLRLRASYVDAPPPSPDHVALVAALRRLPVEQREALVLFHVADLSVERIAADLRIPTGTVKARLARGRAKLAQYLGEIEPADTGAELSVRDLEHEMAVRGALSPVSPDGLPA